MKVNVAGARYNASVEAMEAQRLLMITFAIALGCMACRNKWNYGKRRLNRLVRGSYEEITEWYGHYSGSPVENGMIPDEIPTLYIGMRNQIKALEILVEKIEEEYTFSPEFGGWRNAALCKKRRNRFDELESLRMITRSYWYAMLLHLYHTYGYGGTVLSEIYQEIQKQWHSAMDSYLNCDARRDDVVRKTVNRNIEFIQKLGVSI